MTIARKTHMDKETRRLKHLKWTNHYPGRAAFLVKKYRDRNRRILLAHYGNRCTCCGEREPIFLTIDHVNGGGNRERKTTGGKTTTQLIAKLIKSGFPDGYTILCMNCNQGRYRNGGSCPHIVTKARQWLSEILTSQREMDAV